MKLGLLVALFLVALVQSFSEARIVSRCELKNELGRLLVLPPELRGIKEKILTRVICQLERETQLDTKWVQARRRKRDVEYFEEEMRKLEEEGETMQLESEELLKTQKLQKTNDDTSLRFEELKRIVAGFTDNDVKENAREEMLKLQEDVRDMEEEVDRRVLSQLDQDEVGTAEDRDSLQGLTKGDKDGTLKKNMDGEERNTAMKVLRNMEEAVERRVFNDLDQDETEAAAGEDSGNTQGEDSRLAAEDEERTTTNNIVGVERNMVEDTQEDMQNIVIDRLDQDEAVAAEDLGIIRGVDSLTAEDEERILIKNMDIDEVENTQENPEKRVISGTDQGEEMENASEVDRDEIKEKMTGDTSLKTEKDLQSVKNELTSLTLEELTKILMDKMNAAGDGPKLEDKSDMDEDTVTNKGSQEMDRSDAKMVLEEMERKVAHGLDQEETQKETPEETKESSRMDEGEPDLNGYTSQVSNDEEMMTIEQIYEDEWDGVEDSGRNTRLEEMLRRLIEEPEQDEKNHVEDGKSGVKVEDQPRDKRDTKEEKTRRRRSLPSQRRRLFGIFQLSDRLACSSGSSGSSNICNTHCTNFTDDDISDDLQCFVMIRAWMLLTEDTCSADQDFFHGCS